MARAAALAFAVIAVNLAAAPYDWHAISWIAYAPFIAATIDLQPRRAAAVGWLYGVVATGTLFSWLVDTIVLFSNIPAIGAWGVLLLFGMAFGSPYALLGMAPGILRRRLGSGWVLAFAATWVLVEYLWSFIVLFPYYHGVTLWRFPATLQIVSVTGIWGLSFLVVWVNAAVVEAGSRRIWGPLLAPAWTWVAVTCWGAWRVTEIERTLVNAPTVRLAQLQTEVGMVERMAGSSSDIFADWSSLTAAVPPGAADLIVWPEGGCPYDMNAGKAADAVAEMARRTGAAMVVGGGTRQRIPDPAMGEDRVRHFNSVFFLDATGKTLGRYDKMVPLPFGEYLPLAETFPILADWIQGPGNFRAGTVPVVAELGVANVAAPICYEAILGRFCRNFPTADLLVNGTNDAWYGDTAGPHQHAMLAAIRATELGVPLIRSAYTGVSFVVEPHGHVLYETDLFERVARIVTVRKAHLPTLYAKLGDWFVAACAIGLALSWRLSSQTPARRAPHATPKGGALGGGCKDEGDPKGPPAPAR